MNASLESLGSRLQAPAYAAFRIVVGMMWSFHGMQKTFGWLMPAEYVPAAWSQAWIGGLIELTCGILVALGLFTRAAAFLASGTMAVAYFQFHWKLQFAQFNWLPPINKGELAVVYCFAFLVIFTMGAGCFSLDRKLRPPAA